MSTSTANDNVPGDGEMQAALLHNALRFLLSAHYGYEKWPTDIWWIRVLDARQLAHDTLRQIGADF